MQKILNKAQSIHVIYIYTFDPLTLTMTPCAPLCSTINKAPLCLPGKIYLKRKAYEKKDPPPFPIKLCSIAPGVS